MLLQIFPEVLRQCVTGGQGGQEGHASQAPLPQALPGHDLLMAGPLYRTINSITELFPRLGGLGPQETHVHRGEVALLSSFYMSLFPQFTPHAG